MAGGAAEILPDPHSCPLPLLRTHPPSLLVCCFLVLFAEMGAANTTLVIIRREIGGDKKELLSNCNEKRSRRNTKEPSTKSKLGLQACCKQPQR